MKKRVISIILCIAMVISLMPAIVAASSGYSVTVDSSIEHGTVEVYTYSYADGAYAPAASAEYDQDVYLLLKADDGYQLDPASVKATYYGYEQNVYSCSSVAQSCREDAMAFYFEMPYYDVQVTASFVPQKTLTPALTLPGEGVETDRCDCLPFSWSGTYYGGTKGQFIYPAEALTDLANTEIDGLQFYMEYNYDAVNRTCMRVSVAEIDAAGDELETAFIDADNVSSTVVYMGGITVWKGVMDIPFDEPYAYAGGDLLVTFETVSGRESSHSGYNFITYDNGDIASRYRCNTDNVCNEDDTEYIPKVSFCTASAAEAHTIALDETMTNGTVQCDKAAQYPNHLVYLQTKGDYTSEAVYQLESIPSVVCEDGTAVSVISLDENMFVFCMPNQKVTVSATFEPDLRDIYDIALEQTAGGTVSIERAFAAEDDTVLIYSEPNASFVSQEPVVTYGSGEDTEQVPVQKKEDGIYAFTMPSCDVTIEGAFLDLKTVWSGAGTESNPFQLADYDDLSELALLVNEGSSMQGIYFKLTADIDLDGEEWTSIGFYEEQQEAVFRGVFDGNNHKITNLQYDDNDAYCMGLFGETDGATIKNLSVSGSITGYTYCGLLIGWAENTTIVNCSAEGTVYGYDYCAIAIGGASDSIVENCSINGFVGANEDLSPYSGYGTGGIIGGAYGDVTVKDCEINATIGIGYYYVGGVIGYVDDSAAIENCTVNATLEGSGYYVGGVIGYATKATIEDCEIDTKLVDCYEYVGGVIGYVSSEAAIRDCVIDTAASGNEYVGGVVGEVYGAATIENCEISAAASATEYIVGAIVGDVEYAVTAEDCIVDATVSGAYAGFLIGYADTDSEYVVLSGNAYKGLLQTDEGKALVYNNNFTVGSKENTDQGLQYKCIYERGEKEKMSYRIIGTDACDVKGYYNDEWIGTTYDNCGYAYTLEEAPEDATVVTDARFDYDENYVRMTFTVKAGETPVEGGKLGVYADVMIGENDSAPIEILYNELGSAVGFEMRDDSTYYSSAGAAFRLMFGDMPGVTPVTTWWVGYYSGAYEYYMESLTENTTDDGYGSNYSSYYTVDGEGRYTGFYDEDSGMAFSWQNINLQPGQSQTFCVLLGIGAYSEAPQWASNPKVDFDLTETGFAASTQVSNPNVEDNGMVVSLYCDVDGKINTAVGTATVAKDSSSVDVQPIAVESYSLADLADGDHLIRFSLLNESGRLANTVVSRIVRVENGKTVPLHEFTGELTVPQEYSNKEIKEVVLIPQNEDFGGGNFAVEGGIELTVDVKTVSDSEGGESGEGGGETESHVEYAVAAPGGTYKMVVRFTDGTEYENPEPMVLRELLVDTMGGFEVTMDFDNETYLVTRCATDPVRQGYKFGGWYSDAEYTKAWNFATDKVEGKVTLYAKWIQSTTKAVRIKGVVKEGTTPLPYAVVEVFYGNAKLGATSANESGEYAIDFIENGVYNIVATSAAGKVKTAMVTLQGSDVVTQDLILPAESISSKLQIAENAPDAVVGGLDQVAAEAAIEDHDVEVILNLEKTYATGSEAAEALQALDAVDEENAQFVEIDLIKVVDNNTENATPITETGSIVTIRIPFDSTNLLNVTVARYHDGEATVMKANPAAGEEGFTVSSDKAFVTVYTNKFSTYLIGGEKPEEEPVKPYHPTHDEPVVVVVKPEIPTYDKCNGSELCPNKAYPDIDPAEWYHDGIHYCIQNELMIGDQGLFAPGGLLTRAQLVMMLWRVVGCPVVNQAVPFSDVPEVEGEDWYLDAVRWAVAEGLVEGYDDGTFKPNNAILREELAAVMYRFAKLNGKGFGGTWMFLLHYADTAEVEEYAYEPIAWMTISGIMEGDEDAEGNRTIRPLDTATRAEAATMLMRFCTKILEK